MAIDRVARARNRWAKRAADPVVVQKGSSFGVAALEIDGLFNGGAKHQIDRLEWVAVAREDERESGAGPLDLESGVVRLPPRK